MNTVNLVTTSIYLAGVLSFFSPCIFPIIPVYLSILTKGGEKSIARTLMFVAGLSLTFLVLGFGMGIIGEMFFDAKVRIVAGIIIIILGLYQMEILKIKFLEKTTNVNYSHGEENLWTAFVLGLTFSIGWTPCVGPVLASILFVAGSSGEILKSVYMMIIYLLGLATPFVILSFTSTLVLEKVKKIKKYLGILKKIGGFLILIMGVLLIIDKINIFLTY